MVIIFGNGQGNLSSNPEQGRLHFIFVLMPLGKGTPYSPKLQVWSLTIRCSLVSCPRYSVCVCVWGDITDKTVQRMILFIMFFFSYLPIIKIS